MALKIPQWEERWEVCSVLRYHLSAPTDSSIYKGKITHPVAICLARTRETHASVTKRPGRQQRHWEGSAEWFLLGFTLAPISSSRWARIKWSKKSNCFVPGVCFKGGKCSHSRVISNKLRLQLGPFWFWHNCLSAPPPKSSSAWLMVYKKKGCSPFFFVFLAERKASCRSFCSGQEWGLIISKNERQSLEVTLGDSEGGCGMSCRSSGQAVRFFSFCHSSLLLLYKADTRDCTWQITARLK